MLLLAMLLAEDICCESQACCEKLISFRQTQIPSRPLPLLMCEINSRSCVATNISVSPFTRRTLHFLPMARMSYSCLLTGIPSPCSCRYPTYSFAHPSTPHPTSSHQSSASVPALPSPTLASTQRIKSIRISPPHMTDWLTAALPTR